MNPSNLQETQDGWVSVHVYMYTREVCLSGVLTTV
jgi:hypothetical protein